MGGRGLELQRHDGSVAAAVRCRASVTDGLKLVVFVFQVWIKHINGSHHADGQLSLLQRYVSLDSLLFVCCLFNSEFLFLLMFCLRQVS